MNNESELKMNVVPIEVPDDIEYISQWTSFVYPLNHLILDKTICGCGFTEYCLNNNISTVLCSPRKKLLENKEDQHNSEDGQNKGLRKIYYFRNDYENNIQFDEGLLETPFGPMKASGSSSNYEDQIQMQENQDNIDKDKKLDYISHIKNNLRSYLNTCNPVNNPFKIVVTYDSLHHVLDVLNEYYPSSSSYAVVVDEFQSIFMDATFKATVELDFVEDLKNCENVLYLSATPMLEKYLIELDYFKDLPMYKLIWPKKRIETVRIQRETVRNINKRISQIVSEYRSGRFPNKVLQDGTIKESRELVIFVNSIKSICDIIKKCDLKPEETNIVCSDSSSNIRRLKKVGHQIGNIPMQGQQHKMFTLCTRTTYLGADFYSTCAFTVICSDCNIQTLTVDISLDLPQILGRQRLKENVFRNEVLILYKAETKKMAIINESKLANDEKIENKEQATLKLLEVYNNAPDEEGRKLCIEKWARDPELYKNDYVGMSSRTGKAMFNYLVKVADRRAYDVSRKEYQDDITIKRGIESIESANIIEGELSINDLQFVYDNLVSEFDKDNNFERRMKLLCEIYFKYPTFYTQYNNSPLQTIIPLNYQNYINLLGFEKIRALNYKEKNIINELNRKDEIPIKVDLSSIFSIGDKYTTKQIKEMLGNLYKESGITKTPKASDLEEFFELKPIKVKNSDGKWEHGFEIVKIKE